MIQSSENLVKDRQTDKSDFIGQCPTNVERPAKKTNTTKFLQKLNK